METRDVIDALMHRRGNADASSDLFSTFGPWKQTPLESQASVIPINFSYDPAKGDIRRWASFTIDGSTDQTTNLVNLWTTLSSYKGRVYIPYNTKFTKYTVYSSIPANVTLVDDSVVNSVIPAGYRLQKQPLLDAFGAKPNDATYDNTPALNAMVTYCVAKNCNRVIIPGGNNNWYFNTQPNPFPQGILLEGENPRSFFVRNYTAGSSTEAFLQWTGSGTGGGDVVKGGGLRQLGILSATSTTLGIAIDVLGTTTVQRPGFMIFEDVVVTGNGQFDFGFRMNGQGITVSGSQGQRDVSIRGLYLFRCNLACMQLTNAVHVYGLGIGCFDGGLGGTPFVQITGNGTATTNTNDVYLLGLECEGNITIANCLNVHCQGRASGTLTVDSTATNVSFVGVAGTVANTCTTAVIIDPVNGIYSAGGLTLTNNSQINFSSSVSSSATAGGASALPATPTDYINVLVGGAARRIPYYNP